jgi:hypothetical protein
MKIAIKTIWICFILVMSIEADIVNRYRFDGAIGNLDSVGQINASETSNTSNLKKPEYVSGAPSGNVFSAPQKCMKLENNNSHKQGVWFHGLLPSEGTICFWHKPRALGSGRYLMVNNLSNGLYLIQNASGVSAGVCNSNSGVGITVTHNNDWNFSAFSWDKNNGSAAVYINGTYKTSSSNDIKNKLDLNTKLRVGGWNMDDNNSNKSNQYDGSIYDFQVYDKSISKEGFDALMDNPGSTYPLNEGAIFKFN